MPAGEIAIEPAATLVDAQQALIRHQPRILVFSGHTFMGSLAFEDSRGGLDEHTDADTIGQMLLGQMPNVPVSPRGRREKTMQLFARMRSMFDVHSGKEALSVKEPEIRRQGSKGTALSRVFSRLGDKSRGASVEAVLQKGASLVTPLRSRSRRRGSSLDSAEGQAETLKQKRKSVDLLQSREEAIEFLTRLSSNDPELESIPLVASADDECVRGFSSVVVWMNLRQKRKSASIVNYMCSLVDQRGSRNSIGPFGSFEAHTPAEEKHSEGEEVTVAPPSLLSVEDPDSALRPIVRPPSFSIGRESSTITGPVTTHPASLSVPSAKPSFKLQPNADTLLRLECVVLNGCKTGEIGRHLLTVAEKVVVVCWSTLAEDNAARSFAAGFYESGESARTVRVAIVWCLVV